MKLRAYAASTHQGPYLKLNEDRYSVDLEKKIFGVLDGFGGSGVGDVGCDEINDQVIEFFSNLTQDRESTLPFFYSPRYMLEGNALINALLFAHKKLIEKNSKVAISKRAGASVAFSVLTQNILIIANIGNCKTFLGRRGKLVEVFNKEDFSLLTERSHLKDLPINAMGLFPDLKYQLREVKLEKGDRVIFLSDGVYSKLEDEEILYASTKENTSLKSKINTLFELSNNAGNVDNQTALILEF